MAATKAELLESVDVRELPATRVAPENMTAEPLAELAVGDTVVVYSRGFMRVAKVMTVTPKRAMVAYTTEGAWTSGQKIAEMYLSPGYLDRLLASEARMTAKNYDYLVKCTTVEHMEEQLARWSHLTPERAEADRVEAVERLAQSVSKEAYIAERVEATRARAEPEIAKAKAMGAAAFCTITTKSVKRDEVFGLVAPGVSA